MMENATLEGFDSSFSAPALWELPCLLFCRELDEKLSWKTLKEGGVLSLCGISQSSLLTKTGPVSADVRLCVLLKAARRSEMWQQNPDHT